MEGEEFVASWQDIDGKMVHVEKGGHLPTEQDLQDSERTILHYVTEDNEDKYFTVLGGFDSDFTPKDAIMHMVQTNRQKYPKPYPGEMDHAEKPSRKAKRKHGRVRGRGKRRRK